MNLSLSKDEKLVLLFKYKELKIPNEVIEERLNQINKNNHKLTIERNRLKKHEKKDLMKSLSNF